MQVDFPPLDINDSVETMMEKLRSPDIDPKFIGNGVSTIHQFVRENNYDKLLTLLLYCNWRQLNIDIMDGGNTALHIAAEVQHCVVLLTL